jgi:hypothetical protein
VQINQFIVRVTELNLLTTIQVRVMPRDGRWIFRGRSRKQSIYSIHLYPAPYIIGFKCDVAVRTAVCGSVAVCGGAALCGRVAVCGSAAVCGSVRQCRRQSATVWHSLRGSVCLFVFDIITSGLY